MSAAAPPPCLSAAGAELSRLRVAVVPNARRTGADGLHDGALRVRLNAPPVDGKANETLVAWLADELGLPKRAVRLMHGQSGRRKQLELDAAPEAVAAWLERVLAG
ncbi:hypothetical protein CKO44_04955 [Rubrivivax gelatinosus]|uniref:UPF0235 protein CKO43_16860 n=1 Tax=Rubrivivax gelatinosus TaxID=28068 RepID=A0ABS1DWL4_RUBGE|nr:hypothetical protein [Rubrivivax gelatinosus]MBK1714444.1 hypothetical protein [Rubrivivax gelatinosus]